MKALINSNYTVNPHDWFTFEQGNNKGKRLRIIATESDGYPVFEALDTIKNIDEDKTTKIKRKLLFRMKPMYLPIELKPKTLKKTRKKK